MENKIRNNLIYFFIFIYITTTISIVGRYLSHDDWGFGDWLINYQGGFIRRGLFGELAFYFSLITNLNIGIFILISQFILYATFLLFSYKLLIKEKIISLYSFIIFSPFIFTFQISAPPGASRKEIIYFAILAYIVWIAKTQSIKIFKKYFYIILLVYPIVILSHEMLAIYLPYIVIVYFIIVPLDRKQLLLIFVLLIPSIVSFIVSLYFSGTTQQVADIYTSLTMQNYPIKGGAIEWLDRDTAYGINEVLKSIRYDAYIYYIPIILLSIVAYIPIYFKLKVLIQSKFITFLFLSTIFGSLLLFVVAIDWGRFIYIHFVSIVLLSFLSNIEIPQKINYYFEYIENKNNKIIIISFIFIYSMFWYIPHCCYPSEFFLLNDNRLNIVTWVEPYILAIGYLLDTIWSLLDG